MILSGSLRAGDRLPSSRELVEELGVSRTVVVLAYEQLLAEGYATARRGSGTYVAEGASRVRTLASSGSARLTLSKFGEAAEGFDARAAAERSPRKRYDFSIGRSSTLDFPFETWRRILLRRTRTATLAEIDYGPSEGVAALRDAIAGHLRRSRSVVCEPRQVIVVSGGQQALDLVARILLERGDRVAIEDPSYRGARESFAAHGAHLVPVPVDHDGLDPALLPARARLVFVTPSHQFPSGAVLSLPRRAALLRWAKKANAAIVEDDYDGEFRYEGQLLEPVQALDSEGRVIYLGTFSRTIFPALRIGYLVVPPSLASAFSGAKWLADRHTGTLEQEALAELIQSGAYERYLRRARRRNAARRAVLLQSIREKLGAQVTVAGDRSGTHLVLWLPSGTDERRIVERAAELDVTISGIASFHLDLAGKPALLVGYARLDPNAIREGVRRLVVAIRS
jgi:GntR family transcriptional regulator/MocR family aminotransferase